MMYFPWELLILDKTWQIYCKSGRSDLVEFTMELIQWLRIAGLKTLIFSVQYRVGQKQTVFES